MIRQGKDRDGLQVQVYAGRDPLAGRKRWVSRQVPGKGRAAMKRARQAEAELLAQVAAGQHRGSKTKTVAELIERWPEWRLSVRPISRTTVAAYRGYIDRSILPSLGHLQVGRLDAATLDTFYAHLRNQGGKNGRPMAASSVHQVHAILSGALNRAVVWGWITNYPARLASPPSIERADMQPPVEDAARLLAVAMAEDRELGLFLRLAVVLGARRGELCAVRWSDVDLDQGEVLIAGGIVRVPGESLLDKATKTHAKRRIATGADTVELLRAHRLAQATDALACGTTLAADAYVFSHVPDGSTPINPTGSAPLPPPCPPSRGCAAGCMTCGTSWSPTRGRRGGLAHCRRSGRARGRPHEPRHLRPLPAGSGLPGGRVHGPAVSGTCYGLPMR